MVSLKDYYWNDIKRRYKFYIMVMTCIFSNAYTMYFPMAFLPELVIFIGYREEDKGFYSGLILSMFTIGSAVSGYIWGVITDRCGRKRILIASLAFNGLFCLLFGFCVNLTSILIMRFFTGVFNGVMVTMKALTYDCCEDDNHAISMSAISLAWGIGMGIAPVIGSSLIVRTMNTGLAENSPTLFNIFPYFLSGLAGLVFCILSILICCCIFRKGSIVSPLATNNIEMTKSQNDQDIAGDKGTIYSISTQNTNYESITPKEGKDVETLNENIDDETTNYQTGPEECVRSSSLTYNDTSVCRTFNKTIPKETKICLAVVEITENHDTENVNGSSATDNETRLHATAIEEGITINSDTGYEITENHDTENVNGSSATDNETRLHATAIEEGITINSDTGYEITENHDTENVNGSRAADNETRLHATAIEEGITINSDTGYDITEKNEESNEKSTVLQSMRDICYHSKTALMELARNRVVIMTMSISCLFSFSCNGFYNVFNVWCSTISTLGGLNLTSSEISYITMVSYVSGTISLQLVLPMIERRIGAVATFVISINITALLMSILPLARLLETKTAIWITVIIGMVIIKTMITMCYSTDDIMINNSAPVRHVGSMNGIRSSLSSLGKALGPITSGAIFTWTVSTNIGAPLDSSLAFVFLGFVYWISGIVCYFLPRSVNSKPTL